jgi:Na+/H+ antiporter NhaA
MKRWLASSLYSLPALALIVTNVGYADSCNHFLEPIVSVRIGNIGLDKQWPDEGLFNHRFTCQ